MPLDLVLREISVLRVTQTRPAVVVLACDTRGPVLRGGLGCPQVGHATVTKGLFVVCSLVD